MAEAASRLKDSQGNALPLRIGLASGPVVAGVVGSRRFFYDVWGDAVNVASRMETTDSVGRIQVPEDVYRRLKDDFVLQERGVVEVKGKGLMRTWYLVGRKSRHRFRRRPRRGATEGRGLTRPANLPPRWPFVGNFGHGNHCCSKVVAASVEVDPAIRDFCRSPLASWCCVCPEHSIVIAAALFGIYLLVTGAAQVFFAFSLHVSAGGRVLLFISGAASLVLAVLCFRHFGQGYAILLLAIWIGIGFIFRGVATSISAISDPHLPGRGWQIFLGLISLLAGIVMIGSPFESLAILTLVVGIWLVVIGAFEIVSSFGIRSASKRLEKALAGRTTERGLSWSDSDRRTSP